MLSWAELFHTFIVSFSYIIMVFRFLGYYTDCKGKKFFLNGTIVF